METPALLRRYADFNLWANSLFVNWLRQKPAELMTAQVPSSFPSLQATLLHIWDAEAIWLARLRLAPIADFPSKNFNGTAEDAVAGALQASADLRDFLQHQPDEFFAENLEYSLFNGAPMRSIVADMVLHCIQHSTFHRGQLVTIARSLGLTDVPSSDYIRFTRL